MNAIELGSEAEVAHVLAKKVREADETDELAVLMEKLSQFSRRVI